MHLWIMWWNLVRELRPAFKRTRTFLWFALALAATCTRGDLRGVTSLVRSLGLRQEYLRPAPRLLPQSLLRCSPVTRAGFIMNG